MTPCYLLPVLPSPITLIESVCFLRDYLSWLHRLHRLQNWPNVSRPPLPARLFSACVFPVLVTPSNAQQHREGSGHAV